MTYHRQGYPLRCCVPTEQAPFHPAPYIRCNTKPFSSQPMTFRAMPQKIPGLGAGPQLISSLNQLNFFLRLDKTDTVAGLEEHSYRVQQPKPSDFATTIESLTYHWVDQSRISTDWQLLQLAATVHAESLHLQLESL